ncbi:MAG TPA: universal stress protein [Pelolinea sp.]|nr:universal stress protein [Pelolinea sp.]
MSKRTLKRQLSLFHVIMLGTAGTIAAEIFVLTGHAAAISGPAAILAIIVGGFLSYSIALNYSELATVYPETGGALTYVREAWGKGLLAFLVGSMDSISSTFYCALSAVGFAYSLSIFIPVIPIVPTAIAIIILFTLLNIRGVSGVGNAQIVLGGILLVIFGTYIIYGFVTPNGFSLSTMLPDGKLFIFDTPGKNFASLMKTIALVYAAYIGFEVIADDAEEIRRPEKNIPIAILVSLTLVTLIYSTTMVVTMGTVSWQQLAGSETALTDAISLFMPGIGVTLMGIAGIVATLTSINSSMLSATRESFTLSRDGLWPQGLSRLNRFRVPFVAVIFIGVVSSLITIIGVVDFLSFITSAGYLFVLFWSNVAMIRLRKKFPAINRPFKAPFFPLTPIVASLTCFVVILFSDLQPLLFTGGVIVIFAIYYFGKEFITGWVESRQREVLPGSSRLIVPVINSSASDNLMALAAILAQAEQDINICLLSVVTAAVSEKDGDRSRYLTKLNSQRQSVLENFIRYAVERNVPMYTKLVSGRSIGDAIVQDVDAHRNSKLVLINRPERYIPGHLSKDSARKIIDDTRTNVGVMVDRGLEKIENIIVPIGKGPHSRLAIHLANDIAEMEKAHVDYMRVLPAYKDEEYFEDEMAYLQEIVITELGQLPTNAGLRLLFSDDVAGAIVEEARNSDCDLIISGLSVGFGESDNLFGHVSDQIAEKAHCSVLVTKRYETATVSWLRRQAKRLDV